MLPRTPRLPFQVERRRGHRQARELRGQLKALLTCSPPVASIVSPRTRSDLCTERTSGECHRGPASPGRPPTPWTEGTSQARRLAREPPTRVDGPPARRWTPRRRRPTARVSGAGVLGGGVAATDTQDVDPRSRLPEPLVSAGQINGRLPMRSHPTAQGGSIIRARRLPPRCPRPSRATWVRATPRATGCTRRSASASLARCSAASTRRAVRPLRRPRRGIRRARRAEGDARQARAPGDTGVGKSAIVVRFVQGEFSPEESKVTVGAAFLAKSLHIPEHGPDAAVKFEIWDTAGQERYASLAPLYAAARARRWWCTT